MLLLLNHIGSSRTVGEHLGDNKDLDGLPNKLVLEKESAVLLKNQLYQTGMETDI